MLKAVIFDLDGVVADSHPIHEAAWKTLLLEQGLDSATLNLDFLYAGRPRREILRHYLGSIESAGMEQLGRRKDELYAVAAQQLTTKPGIPRVLPELNSSGLLCALATSAGRTRAHESLEQFSITRQFSLIVTGEDAAVAKPAPEIFLLAAEKLGVKPQECIVVEDSVAGVEAARAAGMRCVAYALPRFAASLAEAGADDVISEFPKDSPTYFKHLVSSNQSQRLALQHSSPRARGR
jgi:HAD superfamily hydrolase (TIGR01509 family)